MYLTSDGPCDPALCVTLDDHMDDHLGYVPDDRVDWEDDHEPAGTPTWWLGDR